MGSIAPKDQSNFKSIIGTSLLVDQGPSQVPPAKPNTVIVCMCIKLFLKTITDIVTILPACHSEQLPIKLYAMAFSKSPVASSVYVIIYQVLPITSDHYLRAATIEWCSF